MAAAAAEAAASSAQDDAAATRTETLAAACLGLFPTDGTRETIVFKHEAVFFRKRTPLVLERNCPKPVWRVQQSLIKLGFFNATGLVKYEGKFGPFTQVAVAAFQDYACLPRHGVVNAATWNALAEEERAFDLLSAEEQGARRVSRQGIVVRGVGLV